MRTLKVLAWIGSWDTYAGRVVEFVIFWFPRLVGVVCLASNALCGGVPEF